MRKLVEFSALGLEPVPWSVPDIGTGKNKAGKKFRFTTRRKKSNLAAGKASLDDWQTHVAKAAREAMAAIPVATGPIRIHFEFYCMTPQGRRHGELWEAPIRWNEEKGEFTKTGPRGKSEPDLTNMVKGAEDALEGIVFANDCLARLSSGVTLFGPAPGVKVVVYEIEPGDFPGRGEPVT
jgi:Holliday junction resolvase RusA-like endonuclease